MKFIPYPKIYRLGYKGTEQIDILPVYVSEKLDGSNVSIHRIEEAPYLRLASRTRWIDEESKQFAPFTKWVADNYADIVSGLNLGEVLWGEFVNNHNVLKYEKKSPFIMFDFSYANDEGKRTFLAPDLWHGMLRKKGLDLIIPTVSWGFHSLIGTDADFLEMRLKSPSMLGGETEGLVIKNYHHFSAYDEPLFVKVVKDEFKEGHKKVYKQGDSQEEVLCQIAFNEARFRKGIHRLKENEQYTGTLQDMGKLLSIIQTDVETESLEDIKNYLLKKHWTSAKKLLNYKIVQRYKQELGLTLGELDETLYS